MTVFNSDFFAARRAKLGLRYHEIATQAGCNAGYLCEIEKGKKDPSLALTVAIACALKCSVNKLVKQ